MTAAGGRRGDLEAVQPRNGSTASAVARLVQPDLAGLEHLTWCLAFPTPGGGVNVCSPFPAKLQGTSSRFRVGGVGETQTSPPT